MEECNPFRRHYFEVTGMEDVDSLVQMPSLQAHDDLQSVPGEIMDSSWASEESMPILSQEKLSGNRSAESLKVEEALDNLIKLNYSTNIMPFLSSDDLVLKDESLHCPSIKENGPTSASIIREDRMTNLKETEVHKSLKSEKPLHCPDCLAPFTLEHSMLRHKKSRCPNSKRNTSSNSGTSRKTVKKSLESSFPYPCKICGIGFSTEDELQKHRRLDHPITVSTRRSSATANESSTSTVDSRNKSLSDKDMDSESLSSSNSNSLPEKPFPCLICDAVYAYPWNLARHMRDKHKNQTLPASANQTPTSNIRSGLHDKNMEISNKPSRKGDVLLELPVQSLKCQTRHKSSSTKTAMKISNSNKQSTGRNKPFPNDQARDQVDRLLATHGISGKTPLPVTCPLCCKNYCKLASLKKHVKDKHSQNLEQQAFRCDHCEKTFSNEFSVTEHVNSDHGPTFRRHKCVYEGCTETFSVNSELKKHMRVAHNIDDSPQNPVQSTDENLTAFENSWEESWEDEKPLSSNPAKSRDVSETQIVNDLEESWEDEDLAKPAQTETVRVTGISIPEESWEDDGKLTETETARATGLNNILQESWEDDMPTSELSLELVNIRDDPVEWKESDLEESWMQEHEDNEDLVPAEPTTSSCEPNLGSNIELIHPYTRSVVTVDQQLLLHFLQPQLPTSISPGIKEADNMTILKSAHTYLRNKHLKSRCPAKERAVDLHQPKIKKVDQKKKEK